MNILVVGNVLKDVYLNLDARTEEPETDRHGVKWLDFAFNNSEHRFFNRMSSFGGAAVSLQVLTRMGLTATISGSDFKYEDGQASGATTADEYRYILTLDDDISYLTNTQRRPAKFVTPADDQPLDYLFIDRSANLDLDTVHQIQKYLDTHMNTALIVYLKATEVATLKDLAANANLVFVEYGAEGTTNGSTGVAEQTQALNSLAKAIGNERIVYVAEDSLRYKKITEPVTVERIDKLTHLSAYSIAAATVLGGFIYGRTVEESLKLARANLENATLDNTLELKELEIISAASPESLELIAATLMAARKGILAADESGGSIHKKFEAIGVEDNFENRHAYRNIFFSTPGIEKYLNGVILFDETARDFADNGEAIPDYLISRRIIPGIKVDEGLAKFSEEKWDGEGEAPQSEETHTKGLATLKKRLREYYEMGLRFAKWRAAFEIRTTSENGRVITPSAAAITENCRELAEYALACQSAGLVPIVEPEVVYDGNYSVTKCAEVTGRVLDKLMQSLKDFGVNPRACILKVNMVLAGKQYPMQSTPDEVGVATAEVLKRHVLPEMAGVVFLSGGQTPEQATANFCAVLENGPYPWPVTFSFARALQGPALEAWRGDEANIEKARQAFLDRLIANTEIL